MGAFAQDLLFATSPPRGSARFAQELPTKAAGNGKRSTVTDPTIPRGGLADAASAVREAAEAVPDRITRADRLSAVVRMRGVRAASATPDWLSSTVRPRRESIRRLADVARSLRFMRKAKERAARTTALSAEAAAPRFASTNLAKEVLCQSRCSRDPVRETGAME